VLWSYCYVKLKSNPIDKLIQLILMEERGGERFASFDNLKLQWLMVNKFDLVFVVFYKGIQSASFMESLLNMVSAEFLSFSGSPTSSLSFLKFEDRSGFTSRYYKCLEKCEQQQATAAQQSKISVNGNRSRPVNGRSQIRRGGDNNRELTEEDDTDEPTERPTATKSTNIRGNNKKTTKEATTWTSQRVNKKAMDSLDFSIRNGDNDINNEINNDVKNAYVGDQPLSDDFDDEDSDVFEDDTRVADDGTGVSWRDSAMGGLFSRVSAAVKRVAGNADLTPEELDMALASFRDGLLSKNVANDIVDQIVSSIKKSLVGTKSPSWTSVHATAKAELTDVIRRILTSKKSVDVLKSALEAKARGEPYSICFLGVNGVGKSTNLAKVCYFLKQKGNLKVMIAACDTFRSGAVEQLRTHARCLDAYLFEQGYGKDPATIAKQAMLYASKEHYDVVLIDTAGRMQDNEPLMRALAKLVTLNSPDLILFVGEALVGNDAVDQLKKFNQCLIDYAPLSTTKSSNRTIDGVLLTKFDTVDDKVGAAVSMVYETGQPIVFVGTGQKYTQLGKLNIRTVVKALLG